MTPADPGDRGGPDHRGGARRPRRSPPTAAEPADRGGAFLTFAAHGHTTQDGSPKTKAESR
jgi:hypothetical protein